MRNNDLKRNETILYSEHQSVEFAGHPVNKFWKRAEENILKRLKKEKRHNFRN